MDINYLVPIDHIAEAYGTYTGTPVKWVLSDDRDFYILVPFDNKYSKILFDYGIDDFIIELTEGIDEIYSVLWFDQLICYQDIVGITSDNLKKGIFMVNSQETPVALIRSILAK